MKRLVRTGILVTAVLLMAVYAQAADILYWSDGDLGTNPFPSAITSIGKTFDTAVSAADFNTKLATGGYAAAILLVQDGIQDPAALSNVSAFLAGGNKMIFSDWSADPIMAAWFGITWSGNTWGLAPEFPGDPSPTFTTLPVITLTAPFLQAGMVDPFSGNPTTAPLMYNPGWFASAMGLAPGSGLAGALFENGDFAVAYANNFIVNGMIADTFADPAQALQFAQNELNFLLGSPAPVPVPPSLLLLGTGLIGTVVWRRRFR